MPQGIDSFWYYPYLVILMNLIAGGVFLFLGYSVYKEFKAIKDPAKKQRKLLENLALLLGAVILIVILRTFGASWGIAQSIASFLHSL